MDPQQNQTLWEVILQLHRESPVGFAIFYGSIAFFVLAVLIGLWQIWGWGPRRRRGMRSARKQLAAGDWKNALEQLKRIRAMGPTSASWTKTFNDFEAECLHAASAAAIDGKRFDEAFELSKRAAEIQDKPEHEVRMNLQSAMLREVRRLFSKTGETDATMNLIVKTLQVQAPCREASFWQALCEIRLGVLDAALKHLQVSRTGQSGSLTLDAGFSEPGAPGAAPAPPSTFTDPSLYLGSLLLRNGRAKESLRFLTEANRMDANCPFITLQLGAAIVTAGGDTNMAVRALQRALGPKGLGQWQANPDRAWVEGMPEGRSYVRKLAEEFPFDCPLFGEDMKYLIRQGNLALAQGQFKLGNFQEAAVLFDKVLKEGAPSLPVLRGLGLSLAKLGRFDDAFVHLRTAHEMEEDKDRLTTGYLALCGACGKPANEEARLQNIAWAVRLVTPFNAPGDAEWVGLLNRIFAEARQNAIALSHDDQLYLCEHLVSVKCCDVLAAQAFHFLMGAQPSLVHPEYAWLYCRADQQHDVGGAQALSMYALTFTHPEPARSYFTDNNWDFDEVELMYLRRAAEMEPGHYPSVLGPEYPARGEQVLLAQAAKQEAAGDREAALKTIEILVKLSPNNVSAMDRAAMLHYRAGRLEPSFRLLEQWQHSQPTEALPLVRQALLLHQQDNDAGCFEKLRRATALSQGRRRANIAFLGARVALESYLLPKGSPLGPSSADERRQSDSLSIVQDFLNDCLAHDASHPHALWCLAAARWLAGDTDALAAQAQQMRDTHVTDPRYHYLAALCHLLSRQPDAVIAICGRIAQLVGKNGSMAQRLLAIEAGYLAGLANGDLGQPRQAIDALKPITFDTKSPTLPYAQALLGEMLFHEKRHEDAINAWQALDATKRQEWKLADPLAQATFINALESLERGDYEHAAEKLRQAGKLGYRDRRLGPLLLLSLFKAGQKAIYASETAPVAPEATNQEMQEPNKDQLVNAP